MIKEENSTLFLSPKRLIRPFFPTYRKRLFLPPFSLPRVIPQKKEKVALLSLPVDSPVVTC